MIKKFIDYLEFEKNFSVNTIKAYKNDLLRFEEFCLVEFEEENIVGIHYNQIRNWIVCLINSGVSNRSVNRKLSSLNGFYKFLVKIDALMENPMAKHRPLKVKKEIQIPFSKEEADAVLSFNHDEVDTFTRYRNKLIIELFYSTGIRRAELVDIRVSDIDFEQATIKIRGKRNKERLVPLLDVVKETLLEYLEAKKEYELDKEFLLITKKGLKIYEMLVYRIINSYFSSVSSKLKKSPHMLRHTFATHLLNEGADLNSVKELLGHASLASTQVYTHNSLEQLKKVFNQAHPRAKKNN